MQSTGRWQEQDPQRDAALSQDQRSSPSGSRNTVDDTAARLGCGASRLRRCGASRKTPRFTGALSKDQRSEAGGLAKRYSQHDGRRWQEQHSQRGSSASRRPPERRGRGPRQRQPRAPLRRGGALYRSSRPGPGPAHVLQRREPGGRTSRRPEGHGGRRRTRRGSRRASPKGERRRPPEARVPAPAPPDP